VWSNNPSLFDVNELVYTRPSAKDTFARDVWANVAVRVSFGAIGHLGVRVRQDLSVASDDAFEMVDGSNTSSSIAQNRYASAPDSTYKHMRIVRAQGNVRTVLRDFLWTCKWAVCHTALCSAPLSLPCAAFLLSRARNPPFAFAVALSRRTASDCSSLASLPVCLLPVILL
jgi:hypothetical protein